MINIKSLFPSAVANLLLPILFFVLSACDEAPTSNKQEDKDKPKEEVSNDIKANVILCFGNSLTEAYGVTPEQSYPHLIQQKIDSLGLDYEVVNAGLSGETTSGGRGRLDWVLSDRVKIFILELGANDGLRGVTDLTETEKNLQMMIDMAKSKTNIKEIILAGMQIPPNLGQQYTEDFKKLFPKLATKNNIKLIPFLLEGVAGEPSLNQKDGIHPTPEGQKIVAENVWEVLKGSL